MRATSQTQVPEREQPVIGVFHIEHFIRPMPMKSTVRAPESIHKIEQRFLQVGKIHLQAIERMEGDGRGKQIRKRCAWKSIEAALWMGLREQPLPQPSRRCDSQ